MEVEAAMTVRSREKILRGPSIKTIVVCVLRAIRVLGVATRPVSLVIPVDSAFCTQAASKFRTIFDGPRDEARGS